MEGIRLILNDGTVIENGRAGYAEGRLWCYIPGLTMVQAAGLFFDTYKTARIVFQYGEMQDVYEGFTRCTRLMDENEYISVCLERR